MGILGTVCANYETELETCRGTITDLSSIITDLTKEVGALERELFNLNSEVASVSQHNNTTRGK